MALDVLDEEQVAAEISKVLEAGDTYLTLATKIVIAEALLDALNRGYKELVAENDRLLKERVTSGRLAIEWVADKLDHEMPPCPYAMVPGRLRLLARTVGM